MPEANLILDEVNVGTLFKTVDMSVGANNGAWHTMKGAMRAVILLAKAAGAVGEPPTITVQQAQAVAGTGAKGLNFTTIFTKLGATEPGVWTKVSQAAASTYALPAGNTTGLVAIIIDAAYLDVANGFDCITANVADVGATAQLGTLLILFGDLRFETTPENQPTTIVD